MNTHSSIPQDQAQEIVNLEQIGSGLSLGRSNDETVSYVQILVHPRTALAWNQVTQTPSLPTRVETPPRPTPYHMPQTDVRVRRSVHPYQSPEGHSRAPLVRQRNNQASSFSVDSPDPLPAAIFCFLDLEEINIALREDEPNLYIILFSNQNLPFVVFGKHWARLGEVAPMYRIKTTTAKHQ
nr:hypothetical protein CFP56_65939 [Quercus suber]